MSSTVPSTGHRSPSRDSAHRGVIALVTEGTYPTTPGGVGTWCHELVTGLPDYVFNVYAITATGAERPVWELPENVATFVKIPVWATQAGPRRRFREAPEEFRSVYGPLLFAIFADDPHAFLPALKGLHAFARTDRSRSFAPVGDRTPAAVRLLDPHATAGGRVTQGASADGRRRVRDRHDDRTLLASAVCADCAR